MVQRGNRREDVFFRDADRSAYLDWLRQYCEEGGVQVLAYCLMTNHVHIVAVPANDDGLERAFRPLHTRYAMRVNRWRGTKGHVWQGRFFSSTLDEAYLWAAIRYVERNPVRAGMVERAERYRWSSASAHCGLGADPTLTRDAAWLEAVRSVDDWPAWLADFDRPVHLDTLREHVRRSLPCGSGEFVRGLELRAGLPLVPKPRGRPRKDIDEGVRPLFA
ncbi:MAG: transposase [Gammaproteobacteria bacterium]